MKEISCNVMKDLMPSYIDEICSEDSRNLVDAHLKSCAQCRIQFEMLKNTMLTDEQGEREKISYLKKVKKHYVNKEIISFVFLTLAIIGEYRIMMRGNFTLLFVLFPLLIIAAYCLMPSNSVSAKRTKFSRFFIIVSIVLLVYFSIVAYWCVLIARTGHSLFGIPIENIGLFLGRQLIFIFVMQSGIFILSNILLFKGYYINKCIYGLSFTGANLAAGYVCVLQNITTLEVFYITLFKVTVCLIIEGIVFSIAAHIFAEKVIR